MDLTTPLGPLTLKNPLIAASGCFGYGVEYADLVDLSTLGGVAVKGLFLAEREGHKPPRIVETPSGMLNAIGLQGIGVHRFVREKLPELRKRRATVFVNICGTTVTKGDVEVRDSGTWRREREDDHGRGLELMRTLMDAVVIEPGAEGTTVSLRRRLGQDGEGT